MMPKPSQFILTYPTGSLDCEPDNWAEVEMGITRQGFGLNREVTSEFIFSRQPALVLKTLFETYGLNAVCAMAFSKRQNDWTYSQFNIFRADFTPYSYDNGKVKMSFIENSIRKLIDDNKGTDYQFDLPTTDNLLYTGVSFEKSNKMLATYGSMTRYLNCWPIRSKRTVRTSTTLFDFETNEMRATAKIAGTFNIEVSIKTMVFQYPDNYVNPEGVVRLVKIPIAGQLLRTEYMTWNYHIHSANVVGFEDFAVYNFDNISVVAGDQILLWYDSQLAGVSSMVVGGTHDSYLKLTNIDPSIYQAHEVPVVSHDWMIEQLIRKIVPSLALLPVADILEYNLPLTTASVPWVPVLTSGSGLIQDGGATITISLENVLKSLKCLYGADYDITGNKMRVDYGPTFFSHSQAMNGATPLIIEPIAKPVVTVDMEHVYNKITVGWETDENATNGQLEINCKNVFTIPNSKADKELNLVHPFKGSMYTIEQYMLDKDSDTNTTKDSDTSVFIFAVNPLVDNLTTLYRTVNFVSGYVGVKFVLYVSTMPTAFFSDPLRSVEITPVTGQFYQDIPTKKFYSWNGTKYVNEVRGPDSENIPTMAYNIPFTPMRLLLANASYIAISCYLQTVKTIEFASTDRKADYYTLEGTETIHEDSIPSASIPAPLFLPLTVKFQTAIKFWTLATINDNLYKYFELVNKLSGDTYKIWIKDVTLQLTRINSQSWKGIAYDL